MAEDDLEEALALRSQAMTGKIGKQKRQRDDFSDDEEETKEMQAKVSVVI